MTRAELKTATKKQLIEYMKQHTDLLQVYRDMPVAQLRDCAIREHGRSAAKARLAS
jgi:hypothetical protein